MDKPRLLVGVSLNNNWYLFNSLMFVSATIELYARVTCFSSTFEQVCEDYVRNKVYYMFYSELQESTNGPAMK